MGVGNGEPTENSESSCAETLKKHITLCLRSVVSDCESYIRSILFPHAGLSFSVSAARAHSGYCAACWRKQEGGIYCPAHSELVDFVIYRNPPRAFNVDSFAEALWVAIDLAHNYKPPKEIRLLCFCDRMMLTLDNTDASTLKDALTMINRHCDVVPGRLEHSLLWLGKENDKVDLSSRGGTTVVPGCTHKAVFSTIQLGYCPGGACAYQRPTKSVPLSF
ncbi:MAG: hypothetical protein KatS3mg054_0138 [Chloroflexus sp.]|nr:MAG: hypothetical protein KatS3mg054_0138 [Chloroflexus sp.]